MFPLIQFGKIKARFNTSKARELRGYLQGNVRGPLRGRDENWCIPLEYMGVRFLLRSAYAGGASARKPPDGVFVKEALL